MEHLFCSGGVNTRCFKNGTMFLQLQHAVDGLIPLFAGLAVAAVVVALLLFAVNRIRFALWFADFDPEKKTAQQRRGDMARQALLDSDRQRWAERDTSGGGGLRNWWDLTSNRREKP